MRVADGRGKGVADKLNLEKGALKMLRRWRGRNDGAAIIRRGPLATGIKRRKCGGQRLASEQLVQTNQKVTARLRVIDGVGRRTRHDPEIGSNGLGQRSRDTLKRLDRFQRAGNPAGGCEFQQSGKIDDEQLRRFHP